MVNWPTVKIPLSVPALIFNHSTYNLHPMNMIVLIYFMLMEINLAIKKQKQKKSIVVD